MTNDLFPDCEIIKDSACGGNHNIPLFRGDSKSWETQNCNVDLMFIKDNEIRIIMEIEEANIKPVHICGKFLASALSSHYIYTGDPVVMGESVLFIQVLDTKQLKEGTFKLKQVDGLKESIRSILPIGNIEKYKLIYGEVSDFERKEEPYWKLVNSIKEGLQNAKFTKREQKVHKS